MSAMLSAAIPGEIIAKGDSSSQGGPNMPPPFTDQPVLLSVLLVSILIWRVMEAILDIKTRQRLNQGLQRQDRGSRIILICAVAFGAVLSTILAYHYPTTAIANGRFIFFWLGILLIYLGMALRLFAVNALGAFFTTTVALAPQQTVIQSGPYRLIRHPSYTGFLLILLGYGLCLANWVSLLILMASALLGLSYRIHVEEHALVEQLGQPYQDYMRRTKRLIPFVF